MTCKKSSEKNPIRYKLFLFDVESLYYNLYLSISMTFHVASLLSSLLYVAMFVFFTLSENKYRDFHNADEGPSQGGKIMILLNFQQNVVNSFGKKP